MHPSPRFQRFVRIATAAALVVVPTTLAAQPDGNVASLQSKSTSVDVILSTGGVLKGYVVDAQGVPTSEVRIALVTASGERISTVSDEKGRFGYRGLENGAYQLETEHGVVLCRAWTATTAPPRSAATMLMVHDEALIRGQWSAPPGLNSAVGKMKRVMTNPLAVATIVGAAVAIPVAIHNADQDDSGS